MLSLPSQTIVWDGNDNIRAKQSYLVCLVSIYYFCINFTSITLKNIFIIIHFISGLYFKILLIVSIKIKKLLTVGNLFKLLKANLRFLINVLYFVIRYYSNIKGMVLQRVINGLQTEINHLVAHENNAE